MLHISISPRAATRVLERVQSTAINRYLAPSTYIHPLYPNLGYGQIVMMQAEIMRNELQSCPHPCLQPLHFQ